MPLSRVNIILIHRLMLLRPSPWWEVGDGGYSPVISEVDRSITRHKNRPFFSILLRHCVDSKTSEPKGEAHSRRQIDGCLFTSYLQPASYCPEASYYSNQSHPHRELSQPVDRHVQGQPDRRGPGTVISYRRVFVWTIP